MTSSYVKKRPTIWQSRWADIRWIG